MKYCYSDHIPFYQKLNYNCPKSYKDGEGEGSCKGYKPGSQKEETKAKQKSISDKQLPQKEPSESKLTILSKQDYKSASNEDKLAFLESEIAKGKKSTSLPDGTYITNISAKARDLKKKVGQSTQTTPISPEKIAIIKETKQIISDIKSEKSKTGKISKQSAQKLKNVTNTIKELIPKKSTDSSLMKPTNIRQLVDNSSNIIYSNKKYIDSAKEYITSSFDMNAYLRKRPAGAKVKDKRINAITELLDKSDVPSGTVLYRGISPVQWANIPKTVGETYIDKNFVSTTTDEKVALGFGRYGFIRDVKDERLKNHKDYIKDGRFDQEKMKPYVLEIRVNGSSTKGLSMEKFVDKEFPDEQWIVGGNGEIADTGNQKEVLLQRSQKFRVIGTESYNDHTRLIIETFDEE